MDFLYPIQSYTDPHLICDQRVMRNMLNIENTVKRMEPKITIDTRQVLIEWMFEVCMSYQMNFEVFFLSVHYMDSFLSNSCLEKSRLQSLSCACLLLSSKYINSTKFLTTRDLVWLTENSSNISTILQFETSILNSLQWQLSTPTVNTFIDHICASNQLINSQPYHIQGNIKTKAIDIAYKSLKKCHLVIFKYSLIAVSSIYLSSQLSNISNTHDILMQMCEQVMCNEKDILHCSNVLKNK